jgi:predicted acetyltransferase
MLLWFKLGQLKPDSAKSAMNLEEPSFELLPYYRAALATGWSPDNTRPQAALEELEASAADPAGFIALMSDRAAVGGPVTLADGTKVPRIPGIRLWMWDGAFCGTIGFRWQPGTERLPPYCPGHIGYAVVPWKRRMGYATAALKQILPYASAEGLAYVELTTDPENMSSQKVISANGGVMVGQFASSSQHGSTPSQLWRIQF